MNDPLEKIFLPKLHDGYMIGRHYLKEWRTLIAYVRLETN